jgi:exonuclease SbcD
MPVRRILHTSDWHLGQLFHDHDRSWEHQQFLDWVLEQVVESEIDALLITGDIFDTANPPITAQRQWNDFAVAVRERRPSCTLVAIAGNHDSGPRIESSGAYARALGLDILGSARNAEGQFDPERLVIPLGRESHGGVWGYAAAIPFLRADDLGTLTQLAADGAVLSLSKERYQAVFEALERRAGPTHARVALGHGVIVGSELERSEQSERDVRIGNVSGLPVDVFPEDLTYVALGHLHRPQRAGGRDHVQYAGSPLPLHVSEADYKHRAVLVEVEDGQLKTLTSLRVPQPVGIVRIPAKDADDDPDSVLAALRALPASGRAEVERQPFIEVRFRRTAPRPNFGDEVRNALAGKGVRLTTVRDVTRLAGVTTPDSAHAPRSLDEFTPEEVFRKLYALHHRTPPSEDLLKAFATLLQEHADAQRENA